jgi:hypothetical protein
MANTILIIDAGFRPPEPVANEAVTPGHLIEWVRSGGNAGKVQKHASAGGPAQKFFALEADYQGRTISNAYASGDRIHAYIAQRGARINAWLASGQNVVLGKELMSNGAGLLTAWTWNTNKGEALLAYATEAVNATSADTRIVVEVA